MANQGGAKRGGNVELFEYVAELGGRMHLKKYSFHWQDAQGKLQRRWDNAPHHPNLPKAPHHIHSEDNSVRIIRLFSIAKI
ncbi:MAG: DUF6516 family protein [bacterium]